MLFESTFLKELPVDGEFGSRLRQVERACASRVLPTPVRSPQLLAFSREMAGDLGLNEAEIQSPTWERVLGGNGLLEGMDPYSACYGGHQFGNWAGQLGDGRAITLGEARGQSGQRLELQLKGAGPTPYSRRADGRAVMRSSVREFLCSEAMYHLGVPTTRALSLVGTGDSVERDMFYDGHPKLEPGAIVCRVAPSFLRFGNFEIFASRGDEETLRKLATYAVDHFFPDLRPPGPIGPDAFSALFHAVCRSTARLVVEWLRVGFVHGVMNTDNMSILGLTIDYGPYGWVEDFDPSFTPNTTDAHGRRYRFGAQPRVAEWNLAQLGNALFPLVGSVEPLQAGLEIYARELDERQRAMMLGKLGLTQWQEDQDRPLSEEVFALLSETETDMTLFFRLLADVPLGEEVAPEARRAPLEPAFYAPASREPEYFESLDRFLVRLSARARSDLAATARTVEERRAAMNRTNPKYVFRNYMAQWAIDAAERGDGSKVAQLLEILRRPYDEQPAHTEWAGRRPEWARHRPGCSMLSCSS